MINLQVINQPANWLPKDIENLTPVDQHAVPSGESHPYLVVLYDHDDSVTVKAMFTAYLDGTTEGADGVIDTLYLKTGVFFWPRETLRFYKLTEALSQRTIQRGIPAWGLCPECERQI